MLQVRKARAAAVSDDPQTLREQVQKILEDLPGIDDPQEQRRLSLDVFELAQCAEAIERLTYKQVLGSQVERLVEDLYTERDRSLRDASRKLLTLEEGMYGFRQERVDLLHRLLADCEAHLLALSAEPHEPRTDEGLSQPELLENLMEVRQFLRDLLHAELTGADRKA
jgi:hypothetical protein